MRKQSRETVNRLLNSKKFVAVKKIHETWGVLPEKVTTQFFVQRADPSLMFRQADNVEGDGHYIIRENGWVGTRHEHAYLVNKNGTDFMTMSWVRRDSNQRVKNFFEDIHYDEVAYILWLTHVDWYKKPSDEQEKIGIYQGKHISWEITYTAYLPPKQGFKKLLAESDFTKNVELTSRDLMRGFFHHDPLCLRANNLLETLATRFESEVYTHGLKEVVYNSRARGMSGLFGGINVMSWVMCGRVMITLEALNPMNPKLRDGFTLIGNEPPQDARFSYHSIYATLDRATEMVETVIKTWRDIPRDEHKKFYTDDPKVKLAGM